jgi:predicted transposase/invertase (TIGR01784 family)
VELSKLDEIIKKSVHDMTDLEKWAVFFQYASVPTQREILNKVIESKEALQMAGNLLMSISQNERERAAFRSRRMYQTDKASDIATAEDRGRQEGGQIKALTIAQNLLSIHLPIDQIIAATGLTRVEVENLRAGIEP